MRFPLDALLARSDRGLLVCTDDMGAKTSWDYFRRCFNPEELARYGELPGINSGFWCGPGERIREWLGHWDAEVHQGAHCPGLGIDQPPLNAAVRRGLIPIDLVPGQMWFPANHWNSPDQAGRETSANYVRSIFAHACAEKTLLPISLRYRDQSGTELDVDPCAAPHYSRFTAYPWFMPAPAAIAEVAR